MPARQHPLRDVGHSRDVTRFGHLDDDPVELVHVPLLGLFLRIGRRGLITAEDHDFTLCGSGNLLFRHHGAIAVPQQQRRHRHVDIHVCVADAETLGVRGVDRTVFQHADHGEPVVAHLDRLSDRILGGEEPRPDAMADDRHRPALFELVRAELLPVSNREVHQPEVAGVDTDQLS